MFPSYRAPRNEKTARVQRRSIFNRRCIRQSHGSGPQIVGSRDSFQNFNPHGSARGLTARFYRVRRTARHAAIVSAAIKRAPVGTARPRINRPLTTSCASLGE